MECDTRRGRVNERTDNGLLSTVLLARLAPKDHGVGIEYHGKFHGRGARFLLRTLFTEHHIKDRQIPITPELGEKETKLTSWTIR